MNKLTGIKQVNLVWPSLLAILFLLSGFPANSLAQEVRHSKVDLNALMRETQKTTVAPGEMTLVWWIPHEFWSVTFAKDRTVTVTQCEELLKVLRPYTLLVVVDGKMGSFGGITYRSETEVRGGLRLRDSQGTYYQPLSQDNIKPDTKNVLSMMKPVLVNMLGPMGKNMHFFAFPSTNKKGQKIADAEKKGAFSVELGQRKFTWRLPLGSLLAPKTCPKCKEKCSGAWNFCAWCGTQLPKPAP